MLKLYNIVWHTVSGKLRASQIPVGFASTRYHGWFDILVPGPPYHRPDPAPVDNTLLLIQITLLNWRGPALLLQLCPTATAS